MLQKAILKSWWTFTFARKLLRRAYRLVFSCLDAFQFFFQGMRRFDGQRDVLVIAPDRPALSVAWLLSALRGVPYYYWSMELYFRAEARRLEDIAMKHLERAASRRAHRVLIQDESRAELLCRENGLSQDSIIIVPNSPMGPTVGERTTYFHDLLGLPHNRKIICQIGQIISAMCSEDLINAADTLPDDCCLLLHSSAVRDPDDPYIQELASQTNGRSHLSLAPLPLDDLPAAVASCHIGLVFYRKDLGPNFAFVSGASGKLAYYLKSCIPVICVDLPGLVDIVNEFDCGICVSAASEIGEAVKRIDADYTLYCDNARKCFKARFDFRGFFDPVISGLDNV